tara:strand:+ start:405 stop:1046 length:642 start_codon:yes stop_codon:yes gene_type:complete
MSSTLVIYIRHGKTPTTGIKLPGRAPGLHLSEEGLIQAKTVAEELAKSTKHLPGKGIASIYSSPMERTKETAKPIAKIFGLKIKTSQGLNECDFGSWTGRKLSALSKLNAWSIVQKQPSAFRFPNGESFMEMQTRIVNEVSKIAGLHKNQTIICVSHADPIKAALASAIGTPLDLFQRIVVGPCSASAVLYTKEKPIVMTINSNGNLGGFSGS